jgi:hypothetical protein
MSQKPLSVEDQRRLRRGRLEAALGAIITVPTGVLFMIGLSEFLARRAGDATAFPLGISIPLILGAGPALIGGIVLAFVGWRRLLIIARRS